MALSHIYKCIYLKDDAPPGTINLAHMRTHLGQVENVHWFREPKLPHSCVRPWRKREGQRVSASGFRHWTSHSSPPYKEQPLHRQRVSGKWGGFDVREGEVNQQGRRQRRHLRGSDGTKKSAGSSIHATSPSPKTIFELPFNKRCEHNENRVR